MANWSHATERRRPGNCATRRAHDAAIEAARAAVAEVKAQGITCADLDAQHLRLAQSDEGAPFAVLFAVRLIVFLVAFAAFVRIGSALIN